MVEVSEGSEGSVFPDPPSSSVFCNLLDSGSGDNEVCDRDRFIRDIEHKCVEGSVCWVNNVPHPFYTELG